MRKVIKEIAKKSRLLLAAALLFGAQTIAPVTLLTQTASAAPLCQTDSAGPNDEPGQKDLNKMCADYAGVPTTVSTTWNWDETGTNGANTMDACNLFDTDGDGNINYAVCVTTQNDPAALQSTTTYSCGDAKPDRCTSPATPVSSGSTLCSVSQVTNDPFAGPPNSAKGDSWPKDTQGACNIQLSTIGGASAKLVDVCSYPSSQPNSDPSDCVVARDNSGKVQLIKDIVPNSDTGLFNLTIDGPAANDTTIVNNVGDNGTTGQVVVGSGSVIVKETPGTNTQLTSYNTTVVCKDLHGTGNVVGQASPTGAQSRQLTFTLADQADVICTMTNTRQQATLVLQKTVVNDNGGTLTTANFPVAIGGNAAQWGSNTVSPGNYTVSEIQQPGYLAGNWGGDCDAQGNVVVTDGQTKTCTITNNDVAGQMRVVKQVTNDNGGSAVPSDFTLSVNGQAKTQNQYFSANAGTYTVTESGPSGYTQTGLSCVNDANQQAVAHPVNLALGQSVTCTVTNDDVSPTLTVIKHVVNDNGGTNVAPDFTMNVTGTHVSSPSFAGAENPGVSVNLNAGSFSVGETGPAGYAASYSTDCSGSIAVGQNKTCTITNNDIAPILTVIKYVTNNNGGILNVADFKLYVGITQVTSGLPNVLNAGSYTVSEQNQPGYTAGNWGGDCGVNGAITLSVGDNKTCTITNDDQPGTLIVKKVVVNNNGGTKEAGDFSFTINGGQAVGFEADGQNDLTVNAGKYTVTEPTADGYTTSYDNCNDVVVPNGGTATCTITNDDRAGTLIVKKVVVNDDGGNGEPQDFSFSVNGEQAVGFEADGQNDLGVDAGTYNVTEPNASGYTTSYENCDEVVVKNGETQTCTITNNDVAPTVTLVKAVVNDNGGTAGPNDFGLTIGGEATNSGDTKTVKANEAVALNEAGLYGYEFVSISGDEGCPEVLGGTVTLNEGENITCTITNNDVAPTLKIVKKTLPADSEDSFNFTSEELGDFSLVGGGNKQFGDLQAGNYTVAENQTDGWKLNKIACWGLEGYNKDMSEGSVTVTLHVGNNITCKFVNEKLSTIEGFKFEDVNFNGSWDEGEPTLEGWTITLTKECDVQSDTIELLDACENPGTSTVTDEDGHYSFGNLEAGNYTVCEELQNGWVQTYPWGEGDCHFVELGGQGDQQQADFGNFKKGEVTGVKFNDINGNGKRDQGEPTLKNWEITLTKKCVIDVESIARIAECEDQKWTTKTGDNGSYSFGDLMPGDYTACETQQDKWIQTFPSINGGCHVFTLDESDQVVTADFGNKPKPQVLEETTTLINTGTPATKGLLVGMTILSVLGAIHLLGARRKDYAK